VYVSMNMSSLAVKPVSVIRKRFFMRGFSTPFLRDCSRLDITGLAYYSLFSFVTKFTSINLRTGITLISS
jgi:hypothetical protein